MDGLSQKVNDGQISIASDILFSADATVSLQMIPSVAEGSNFMVAVFLSTPMQGSLDCDLVVTLLPMAGTAMCKT